MVLQLVVAGGGEMVLARRRHRLVFGCDMGFGPCHMMGHAIGLQLKLWMGFKEHDIQRGGERKDLF